MQLFGIVSQTRYLYYLYKIPFVFTRSFIVRTDPADVARVESKTFICTDKREDTIPTPAPGVEGKLGKWESPETMREKLFDESFERFPGCMKGTSLTGSCNDFFYEFSDFRGVDILLPASCQNISTNNVITRKQL